MEWERGRPSSFARALFLSIAFRLPDARQQSRSFARRNQSLCSKGISWPLRREKPQCDAENLAQKVCAKLRDASNVHSSRDENCLFL